MTRQPQITIETLTDCGLAEFMGAAQGEEVSNYRRDQSYPVLTSATLCLLDAPEARLPVIMREISVGGFGLLHTMPIDKEQIGAIAISHGESPLIKTAEVIWCHHAAANLYLSGWQFVRVD